MWNMYWRRGREYINTMSSHGLETTVQGGKTMRASLAALIAEKTSQKKLMKLPDHWLFQPLFPLHKWMTLMKTGRYFLQMIKNENYVNINTCKPSIIPTLSTLLAMSLIAYLLPLANPIVEVGPCWTMKFRESQVCCSFAVANIHLCRRRCVDTGKNNHRYQ